jgi:AcrR family transcriptional regulator
VARTAAHAETRRLPPGSHGIPADVVARNQRERLIAAMAEACTECGYADTSVADVVKRAGVSTVTFYKQFADKRDCMLAAHRQLLGRLLEAVDRAREAESGDGETRVRAVVRTALDLFAADPPSARLLTIEILAAGPEGGKRHGAAVQAFERRLWAADDPCEDLHLPLRGWVEVAGMFALIGKRVLAGEAARLPALEDELVALIAPGA